MSANTLKIVVAGRVNVGKTSFLRTLMHACTHDDHKGLLEPSDEPGSTRDNVRIPLMIDGKEVAELFDTPGLQQVHRMPDPWKEALLKRGDEDEDEVINELIASKQIGEDEKKALNQALNSDIILYIIDASAPYLEKNMYELAAYQRCKRPVMAILNFVNCEEGKKYADTWHRKLRNLNITSVRKFDAWACTDQDAQNLYEDMLDFFRMEPDYENILKKLSQKAKERSKDRLDASCGIIADLLIDVASYGIVAHKSKGDKAEVEVERTIQDREGAAFKSLLSVYGFPYPPALRQANDLSVSIEVSKKDWRMAVRSTVKRSAAGGTAGTVVGVLVGATVDVLSFGATGGMGIAAGVAIGGGSLAAGNVMDKVRGRVHYRCNDETLTLLASRQIGLVKILRNRGAANQTLITYPSSASDDLEAAEILTSELKAVRNQSKWSKINPETLKIKYSEDDPDRLRFRDRLIKLLRESW